MPIPFGGLAGFLGMTTKGDVGVKQQKLCRNAKTVTIHTLIVSDALSWGVIVKSPDTKRCPGQDFVDKVFAGGELRSRVWRRWGHRGQDLSGVHQAFGVEGVLDALHEFDLDGWFVGWQEAALELADAVFGGDGAAEGGCTRSCTTRPTYLRCEAMKAAFSSWSRRLWL